MKSKSCAAPSLNSLANHQPVTVNQFQNAHQQYWTWLWSCLQCIKKILSFPKHNVPLRERGHSNGMWKTRQKSELINIWQVINRDDLIAPTQGLETSTSAVITYITSKCKSRILSPLGKTTSWNQSNIEVFQSQDNVVGYNMSEYVTSISQQVQKLNMWGSHNGNLTRSMQVHSI